MQQESDIRLFQKEINQGIFDFFDCVLMTEGEWDRDSYQSMIDYQCKNKRIAGDPIKTLYSIELVDYLTDQLTLTEEERHELIEAESGCGGVRNFVSDNCANPKAFGIIDKDLADEGGTFSDDSHLYSTDSCDIESTILCCLPSILESSLSQKAGRNVSCSDADDKENIKKALFAAFCLGKLKFCQNCIASAFPGGLKRIKQFFEASDVSSKKCNLQAFLGDGDLFRTTLWFEKSNRNPCPPFSKNELTRVCSQIVSRLKDETYPPDASAEWHCVDEIFGVAFSGGKFTNRNKIWRFCNGHDFCFYLKKVFDSPRLDDACIEDQIHKDFQKSDKAKRSFEKTPLGVWMSRIIDGI